MVRYFNILLVLLSSTLLNCTEDPEINPEVNPLSAKEALLSQKWQYALIRVQGITTVIAEPNSEPVVNMSSVRQEIKRRWISYARDKNYQLQWDDRGNYTLGTEGDPNWQPNFGYWHLTENEDSLIHNAGQHYETRYKITIEGNRMTRASRRYMSNNLENIGTIHWQEGDWLIYTEEFILVQE